MLSRASYTCSPCAFGTCFDRPKTSVSCQKLQWISWPCSIPVESGSVFGKIFDGRNIFLGQIGLFGTDLGPPSSLSCGTNILGACSVLLCFIQPILGSHGPIASSHGPIASAECSSSRNTYPRNRLPTYHRVAL